MWYILYTFSVRKIKHIHIYIFGKKVNIIPKLLYKCQINKLLDISCGGLIYTHMSDNIITISIMN